VHDNEVKLRKRKEGQGEREKTTDERTVRRGNEKRSEDGGATSQEMPEEERTR
jgi:hypothetical protein